MKKHEPAIFIVDDDSSLCRALARLLRSAGYNDVHKYESAEDFLCSAHVKDSSLLLLDLQLPGMNGVDLLKHLRRSGRSIPVVLISAHDDELRRADSMKQEAVAILHKPFEETELLSVIHSLTPLVKAGAA